MRSFLALFPVCALSLGYQVLGYQVSLAQTSDCKTITDPATRLNCYDKINPPIGTYPIPLPKPAAQPLSMPQSSDTNGAGSPGDGDAAMVARMNGICRGC
jgi:hypothetical protein